MKNPEYEVNLTEKIKARLLEEEGFEEIISDESWAAEKNKGKKLNKPFRTPGGPKKFSVYVKNDKGNVVKVNFGDPKMEIKRDDPARRKSFRARHGCDNPGPKTKAKYWSCKMWSKKSVTKVTKGSEEELEEALAKYMDESDSKRSGPKSGAQTPAKPSEKKKGSSKNKPGSAGEKGSKITFSEKVINSLKSKVAEHNKEHPSKKVTLGQLKKVYRRGAGAFSSSHRPGMTRGGWAMARVNMFLKMKRGGKVKESYRKADQDISKSSEIEASKKNHTEEAFMKHCVAYDKDLVDTANMDDKKTYATCAMQYKKMKTDIEEKAEGGLTEKQKKLPKPIRDSILKKQGEEMKDSEAATYKDKEKNKKKKSYSSLWENIRNKKKRMGKNYKPAKPGDKDRPEKKAWDKAKSSEEDEKKNFKPHKMYDPKTGKAYDAKTYEDHLKMKKMGYTHEGPEEKSEAYKSSKKKKKKKKGY